jgi:hypothetical protein
MKEIKFDTGELFALARSSFATRTKVTATQPFGIVELDEQDLEDYLRRTIPLVGDVRVKASGIEVRFVTPDFLLEPKKEPTDDDLSKPARFLPVISGGRLVLRLIGVSQVPLSARGEARRMETLLNLPKVPKGLSADVKLGNKAIVVEAQGAEATLVVGEGEER